MRPSRGQARRAAGLLVLVLLALSLLGCAQDLHKPQVALIIKGTESEFWAAVCDGANTASAEYNMELTVDGPASEEDFETQNQMLEDAIESNVQAIILSAIDYNQSVELVEKARKAGIYVVVIDSDVNTDKVNCRIGTDNYRSGQMVAEEILRQQEGEIAVGIVNFDVHSANGHERELGFREQLVKESRARIVDTVRVNSNLADAKVGARHLLERHPELTAIVSFNEWTTLGVGYAVEEMNRGEGVTVVGFDNNLISVEMLENGVVDALIVQNPFAMGYLGVESAYTLISGRKLDPGKKITNVTVITHSNLYAEASQKIVFPFDR